MILNAVQERQNVRDVNLRDFLTEKKKEYEARMPFKEVVDILLGNIALIDPLASDKGNKGVPATKSKQSIKNSLSADVNEICTNTTAYARSIGDENLLYAVRYRASDIKYAKDGDVRPIVTIIIDAITPILSEPAFMEYEITDSTLSDLGKKADNFNSSRGKAAVLDTDSSIANKDIDKIQKDIRRNVSDLNLLITWFDKKNPAFAEGFRMRTPIDNSGIRHSGVYGIIKNSNGALVDDASITLKGKKNTKTAATNDDGAWEIVKFVSGKAKLTVSAPGCETMVIPVTITRGKIIELNITLQAKVISLTATA